MSRNVTLRVTPASSLADEVIDIQVDGIAPDATATLRLTSGPWRAAASFRAGATGAINPAVDAPIDGSYSGIDAMGLFWSCAASAAAPPFATSSPDTVQIDLECDGRTVAVERVERLYAGPGVSRTEVRDDGLLGVLYMPAGSEVVPGVLLLSGSGGGVAESAAALLASHGFAALTLAYFNYGPLQPDLCEIPLEYFEKAIGWMSTHPRIDGERLAVRGVSRGGELALQLGATFDAIRAVIALVPSSVRWASISGSDARMNRAAWTYRGEALPYNTRIVLESEANPQPDVPVAFTPGFRKAMQYDAPADFEIPVERINGPVLLVSGDDDAMWPSTLFSERVCARLADGGFRHEVKHLRYPNAGHRVVQVPYQPTTPGPSVHPVRKIMVAFGGTPAGDAAGSANAWGAGLEFLNRVFG